MLECRMLGYRWPSRLTTLVSYLVSTRHAIEAQQENEWFSFEIYVGFQQYSRIILAPTPVISPFFECYIEGDLLLKQSIKKKVAPLAADTELLPLKKCTLLHSGSVWYSFPPNLTQIRWAHKGVEPGDALTTSRSSFNKCNRVTDRYILSFALFAHRGVL